MNSCFKYRLRCVTEGLNKTILQDGALPAPTQCPDNAEHTIDPASLVVLNTLYKD